MRKNILSICAVLATLMAAAQSNSAKVNLAEATIVYNDADAPLVRQMAQVLADKWGIMITTSHCEPLLFNNASPLEWNKERDGEWKIQVLENRKEFTLTLPLDGTRSNHTITLSIIDPGQIIQKITYQ